MVLKIYRSLVNDALTQININTIIELLTQNPLA